MVPEEGESLYRVATSTGECGPGTKMMDYLLAELPATTTTMLNDCVWCGEVVLLKGEGTTSKKAVLYADTRFFGGAMNLDGNH